MTLKVMWLPGNHIYILERARPIITSMQNDIPQPWKTRYARWTAQCRFRGEAYELTPQEYMDFWLQSGHSSQCGRGRGAYSLCRIDHEQPWSVRNMRVVERGQHARVIFDRYVRRSYFQSEYAFDK